MDAKIERCEMNNPRFKEEQVDVQQVLWLTQETNCAYEIEDGKVARLVIYGQS